MNDCPRCFSPIANGVCTNAFCGYRIPEPTIHHASTLREEQIGAARRRRVQRSRADQAKADAMEKVDAAAEEKWKALADAAIVEAATARLLITADDVWKILDARGVVRPREARALGPRMARAAKAGIITKDTAFVPSERTELHATPIQSWKSLVFRGPK